MPLGSWNLQWLNHNSQRSYPIIDWGSSTDQTGTIKIPDNFIVGLYLPVHAGLTVKPEKFYIRSIAIYPNGYSITIGYDDDTITPPVVANVNIDASAHVEYTPYALSGAGDFSDSVGKIIIGKLDDIEQQPAGLYFFDPEAATLETDAIRPMIRGISSLTVINGSDRSEALVGDIELAAGSNMRITAAVVGAGTAQVVFSAIEGEGLNEACVCDDDSDPGACIRFINGIPPLADGNFRMVGNKCIDIRPITNGLQLVDLCAEPCCGCDELEAVIRQVDRFSDGITTMERFVTTLNAEVIQMRNVVLGSRLSDNGCITCE